MQGKFKEHGCFVENFKDKCILVAKGNRIGRMFTLNVNIPKVGISILALGPRVFENANICLKWIGHVILNLYKCRELWQVSQNFKMFDMQKLCEAL